MPYDSFEEIARDLADLGKQRRRLGRWALGRATENEAFELQKRCVQQGGWYPTPGPAAGARHAPVVVTGGMAMSDQHPMTIGAAWRQEREQLQEVLRLRHYAKHDEGCKALYDDDPACTCGLTPLLLKAEELAKYG